MKWSKRLFDLLWSTLGLAVLWPLFVLVTFLIKLEDGGPAFFRQERVGYRGQRYRVLKFRTMVVGADRQGKHLTVGRDPRITRVGYWLRRFKIDEIPQLVNVLIGQMSLVGPRPEVPRYVALYTPAQREVLDVMPGITDPASIAYRSESELLGSSQDPERTYIEEIMPDKIRLNLQYATGATLGTDVMVILRTLVALGQRRYRGPRKFSHMA